MTTFNFKSVQLLELLDADAPTIDVQDGHLILTAERGGESIRITAPLKQTLPQVVNTTVKLPAKRSCKRTRIAGGKKRAGEMNGMAKLTEAKVREIRLILSDKKLTKSYNSRQALFEELARAYGVHFATIRSIAYNQSWKSVTI